MNGNGSPDVPVWLLDVDGVINASSKPGWHAPPRRRYVYADGMEFKMRWAPSLTDAIADLIRTDVVEIRWATSWVTHIEQINRTFSLPIDLPLAFTLPDGLRAATDEMTHAAEAAKRASALDVVHAGRRLIWTDDEAIWRAGPERERLDDADALLIAPAPNRGLQPADMDRIRTFLGQ